MLSRNRVLKFYFQMVKPRGKLQMLLKCTGKNRTGIKIAFRIEFYVPYKFRSEFGAILNKQDAVDSRRLECSRLRYCKGAGLTQAQNCLSIQQMLSCARSPILCFSLASAKHMMTFRLTLVTIKHL